MDSRPTAVDDNASRSDGASLRSPPLIVGRSREQDILRAELAAACSGHGRLVILGGEAGIGKSTLAQDLVRTMDGHATRVLVGHCYDLTNTPPYGPWLDLFEAAQFTIGLPAPPVAFAGGALAAVADQAALFADVRRYFAELSADRPALVLLEDLHWADPASLELLRHVAPHLRHWPIVLLATYRVDELSRVHPLSRQLPALVREADGQRLDLRGLDQEALRALVSGRYRLTLPDEDRLVGYLERHAEGNPFFATEILRTLEERTLLRRDKGSWALSELDRFFVPSLLRQVIDGRIACLGEATRRPLAIAAVIGQEVPLDLWAHVAELDEEGLLDVVERSVEAHLLEAARDGTLVHFVHALTREALYEGILPPRRRVWHRRVAETLMADAQADPDAVAFHLQEAGDPGAWEWLVKAADRAQRAYAWLTAAERLRAAVALLEGVDGAAGTRSRLLYRLAHLARFSDPASAIAPLTEAERLAAQTGDAVMEAELRYPRGLLLCYTDRLQEGLATMMEGIEAVEAFHQDSVRSPTVFWEYFIQAFAGTVSPPTRDDELAAARLQRAGLDSHRCAPVWFSALAGQPRDAVTAGERFLTVLAPGPGMTEGARYTAAFTEHGLGIAYAALGRPNDAREAWARSRATFRDLGHHVLVAFSLCNEFWDRVYPFDATDPTLRRHYAAEAEAALGRAGGALSPGVSPRLAQLTCLLLDGEWLAADRVLEDLPLPGNNCLRREVTAARAVLARHRGQPQTAWAQIRPLFPHGPATEPGDVIHQEGLFLQRLAADLCVDAGNLPGAYAWLEAHDRWLAWSESVLGRADGKVAWARYHWASGDSAPARAAADAALALAAVPDQPLVWLTVHRLLGEIDTAAGQHAAADAHLAAALELATTCEAPFERALTLLALAELHTTMGNIDEAATLLDESRQICIPLGVAPTLARVEALAVRLTAGPPEEQYPAGLTPREVEVLRLLPRGLSNAEIAEELFVSARTVQTHLTNLYGKLGVGGRAEAVAYAMAHGLA